MQQKLALLPSRAPARRIPAAGFLLLGWALAFAALPAGAETAFAPPEKLTDGTRKYQLSRNPNSALAYDSSSTLHLAHWSGEESAATSPAHPAHIFYQSCGPAGAWSSPVGVDDSFNADGHIGGRHPSLAIAPDNTVWIAWHDHRDCTPGNWMDNTEIYLDRKPAGGAFSSADFRLSQSTPPSFAGDNSFTVRLAADARGRISAAWYDFHFGAGTGVQPDISDIFLRTSGPNGLFDPADTMASMRLTRFEDRGGMVPATPSFTLPDLAVDAAGARHLIWVTGTSATGDLYHARVDAAGTATAPQLVQPGVRAFFDPPHLAAGPAGEVWLAYATAPGAVRQLWLRRLSAGAATFGPAIPVAPDPAVDQYSPDVKVDAAGRPRLVWIRKRSVADRDVCYAVYNPATGELEGPQVLTAGQAGRWDRPALALGPGGAAAVVFEDNASSFAGDLWCVRATPPLRQTAADSAWQSYP